MFGNERAIYLIPVYNSIRLNVSIWMIFLLT